LLPEIICLAEWGFWQELWNENDLHAAIITSEKMIGSDDLPSSAAP
jgi:hypothetical protein